MVFEHELNALAAFKGLGHKPDIVFSAHQCLEMELSAKQTYGEGKLADNFESNLENYSRQIWVVPDHKQGLMTRINELALKHDVTQAVRVIPLSTVISEVSSYDARTNAPRMEPVKGMPAPLHVQNG